MELYTMEIDLGTPDIDKAIGQSVNMKYDIEKLGYDIHNSNGASGEVTSFWYCTVYCSRESFDHIIVMLATKYDLSNINTYDEVPQYIADAYD